MWKLTSLQVYVFWFAFYMCFNMQLPMICMLFCSAVYCTHNYFTLEKNYNHWQRSGCSRHWLESFSNVEVDREDLNSSGLNFAIMFLLSSSYMYVCYLVLWSDSDAKKPRSLHIDCRWHTNKSSCPETKNSKCTADDIPTCDFAIEAWNHTISSATASLNCWWDQKKQ